MALKRRKRGRPTAARKSGGPPEIPRIYVQTTLRLDPFSKAGLDAVASLQSRGLADVVEDAIELLIAKLPIGDRELVETLRTRYIRGSSGDS